MIMIIIIMTRMIVMKMQGVKLPFFPGSHLAPKNVVANSKTLVAIMFMMTKNVLYHRY